MATVIGTEKGEFLEGTLEADLIFGYGGDDLLIGHAGDDTLYDGAGVDSLFGGDGDDLFVLNDNNSISSSFFFIDPTGLLAVSGGAGFDTVSGVEAVEALTFDAQTFYLSEIEGFIGSSFDDSIDSSLVGVDVVLAGEAGNDRLIGGSGSDRLTGGAGDDFIQGGLGADILTGGRNTVTPEATFIVEALPVDAGAAVAEEPPTAPAAISITPVEAAIAEPDLAEQVAVVPVEPEVPAVFLPPGDVSETVLPEAPALESLEVAAEPSLTEVPPEPVAQDALLVPEAIMAEEVLAPEPPLQTAGVADTYTLVGDEYLEATVPDELLTSPQNADIFSFPELDHSLLGSSDIITDLEIGIDVIRGPYQIAAGSVLQAGNVESLSESSIQALLPGDSLVSFGAATFTLSSLDQVRTFLLLNDAVAGFQQQEDAVIEITGYAGDLSNLAIG